MTQSGTAAERWSAVGRSPAPTPWLAVACVLVALLALTSCSAAPLAKPGPMTRLAVPGAGSASTGPTYSAPGTATPATPSPSADAGNLSNTAWRSPYTGRVTRGFVPELGYKAVALTFDDGPNHETSYVIHTLERFGGHATFFFTGKLLSRPGALRQATLVESHAFEVGNHTQDHSVEHRSSLFGWPYSFDVAQISGPDRLLESVIGHPTLWLRPMGGSIDPTGVRAALDTGHLVITWTVDSNDSRGWNHTPDFVLHNATTGVVSGDVILLHATHPESMAALPRICASLRAQGFQLVTLSELASHSRPLLGRR